MRKLLLYILILSFVFLPQTAYAVGAFPGCEGYGCSTRHAYTTDASPDIYIVNTLDCDGARVEDSERCPADTDYTCGTDYKIYESGFETAVESAGAKIIIIEVGGRIDCADRESIRINGDNDELFIAGQTSPSPGVFITGTEAIIITGYGALPNPSNVVVQHLRVMGGDDAGSACLADPSSCDNITVFSSVSNVVIDHVSTFFDKDENINIGTGTSNVTVSNSIMAFPLEHESVPGFGPLLQGNNWSLIKNLIAHHYYRNPMISNSGDGIIVNNLIYNWGSAVGAPINVNVDGSQFSVEGNYMQGGSDTGTADKLIALETNPTSTNTFIYCADDYLVDTDTTWTDCKTSEEITVAYGGATYTESGSRIPAYPSGISEITILTPANARTQILASSGAYPAYRANSAWDTHAIDDATNDTGGREDTVADYGTAYSVGDGGWGTMTSSGPSNLVLPANPHSDDDSDGYTNLEEWIHSFTAIVEGTSLEAQNVSPIDGGAGYSITASATWYYSAYVDDVELWLDTGACDGTPLDGDLDCINTDDCVGDESSGDADFTYDMSTLVVDTTYCLTLQTNYGAEQGDWQQFDFETTGGPPTPPEGLATCLRNSLGLTGSYDDQGLTVGE